MPVLAGQRALADDFNSALAVCIGGEARGSNTSTITTTETAWASTGASDLSLAASSIYEIEFCATYSNSVNSDEFDFRLRDLSVAGTNRYEIITPKLATSGVPYAIRGSFLWTTTLAENNKWVATVVRLNGTGNITVQGGSYVKATYIGEAGTIATI